jgi:hypothetical protein
MDNSGQIGMSFMNNWGKLGSSLIFYFVSIDDWRCTIRDPWQMHAETYTRLGTGAPASNYINTRESWENSKLGYAFMSHNHETSPNPHP